MGYVVGYAYALAGVALLHLGEPGRAIQRFQAGLHVAVEVHHPRMEGICLYDLAWAYWKQGDYAAASTAAEQAVDACRRADSADLG